jgi:hypothetical protein
MHIRKAADGDLSDIMDIYIAAQDFMIKTGNPNQWGHSYPSKELIKSDIDNENCFLICDDDAPHGVFALFRGDEPTYHHIENGKWINDDEYLTIHRIASDGKVEGVFRCAVDYCKSLSDNIRIDTHDDNIIMQTLIEKNGFEKCGTIYVADGSPRIAYQWIRDEKNGTE